MTMHFLKISCVMLFSCRNKAQKVHRSQIYSTSRLNSFLQICQDQMN